MKNLASYPTCMFHQWILSMFAMVAVVGIAMCCPSVAAQNGAGRIQGTVTDSVEAVIPNATIVIRNGATGQEYRTISNATGFYTAPSLFTGSYLLTVDAPGMAQYEVKVELNAGQTAVIDPHLKVATATEKVTVAADMTTLATYSDQTVSTTLEFNRINQLPMNGRAVVTLVGMTTPGIEGQQVNGNQSPAAFEYIQDGAVMAVRDMGYAMTLADPDAIQEVRVETNNSSAKFNRPGTAVMTTRAGGNAFHGAAFETARNNAFGVARNRQDTYTKAPKYIRNEFGFSLGGPVLIPKLYNGHNKSFFFAAYERYSKAQGVSAPMYMPTDTMRGGDFSGLVDASTGNPFVIYDPATSLDATGNYQRTAFPNNKIPLGRISPLAKTLFALEPEPTNTSVTDPLIASNYTAVFPTYYETPTLTVRVDQHFGDKDSAYLRYTHTRVKNLAAYGAGNAVGASNGPQGPVLMGGVINQQTNPEYPDNFALSYTHVFSPTFYMETTVSNAWDRTLSGGAGNQDVNYTSQLGLPNPFGQLTFPGIFGTTNPGVGNQQGSLLMNFYYGTYRSSSEMISQIDENITKIIGKHQLQFGVRYEHERISQFPDQQPSDRVTFGGLGTGLVNAGSVSSNSYSANPYTGLAIADFFLGSAQGYAVNLNHTRYNLRNQEIASYFQDDYHANRKLVINAGLRWEIHPAIHEHYGYISSFDLPNHAVILSKPVSYYESIGATTASVVNAMQNVGVKFETAAQAGLPPDIANNNYFTFAPRVGFAYRLFGDTRTTVVRGGFGTYIYPNPLRNFYPNNSSNAPFRAAFSQGYTSTSDSPDGLANYILRQPQAVIAGATSTSSIINTTVVQPGQYASGLSPKYPVTYDQEGSFTIEQGTKFDSVARISYIYSHGTNLEQYQEFNTAPSNYVWFKNTGQPLGTGATASIAQNPYDNKTYGTVEVQGKTGYSNAHVVEANWQRLYHNGYAFQAFYTFSSALRNAGNGSRDSFLYPVQDWLNGSTPFSSQEGQNHFLNYVRMSAIPKHRIRFNGVVDVPIGRGKRYLGGVNRPINELVGGWQIAGSGTVLSQFFGLSTSNWGPAMLPHIYKHQYPVKDCRSGTCLNAYMYFNGYIAPSLVNTAKGVQSIPSGYVPDAAPLNSNGTNTVSVQLANGTTVSNVAYSPGPGLHPFAKTYLPGPFNWSADGSLFKIFPITERVNLRINVDAFNLFNVQGYNNPDSTTGIENMTSSYNTARQLQLTARITF